MGHGAEMNGCGKCLKYLMFTFNFLALCGGLVAMAVGIWTCVDHASMERLLGTNLYMSAAYILIATGIVVVLVSFFGCLGAVKEIKCMLLTYFIVMFGLFVTMLVGGILGYAFREKVLTTMRTQMYSSVAEYGNEQAVTDAWDTTQTTLKCCGVEGASGFEVWLMENKNFDNTNRVPKSCCQRSNDIQNCIRQPTSENAWVEGCLTKAQTAINGQAAILGGVGVGIAFVMLLGMIFSMALFKMIK